MMTQADFVAAPRPWITAIRGLLLMFALLVPSIAGRTALAQVEPIEARWMVVTRDAEMRCGEVATFYKVADLKSGQVVRMDARSPRWARVVYPEDQFAFVGIADAVLVSDHELRLENANARVRAPNALSGLAGSWRSLYLGEVKPGTTMRILGKVESREGQTIGYRVVPPKPPAVDHLPYGYVELAALRDATPEEVEAHQNALRPAPPPTVTTTPAPEARPETAPVPESSPVRDPGTTPPPAPRETTPPATTPATTPATPAAAAPDTSLIEEMAPPTEDDRRRAQPEPAPVETTPARPAPAPEAAIEAAPRRDWLGWEELENELRRVRARGGPALEDALDELIAEYARSLTHAESDAMRRGLESRLEWLRLRRDARDQRLAIDTAVRDAEAARSAGTAGVRAWQDARGYDIVGRLVPSAIYDGQRLPLMFRVRAVEDSGLVRTVGYIRDVPELGLGQKIGQVVGVIGESRLDSALRLRVITPVRIDTLEARRQP